ncbi:MAG: efflux RND transporter periplasmic adaptor subunit [Gammaproteobacteria bacterium]|nr:efflux RND transporter periplasmic adaptor subunit [Gammaproteobacteria bacterium]
MRTAVRLLVALALLAVIFGGIFGWKQWQQQSAGQQQGPPPATVTAVSVSEATWRRTLNAVGSLVATQGIYVTTEVAGQVDRVAFDSGQAVDAGAPLVELEKSVDLADLEGLVAEQKLAEIAYRRADELVEQRSVSRAEYDRTFAELEFARARVAAKRAQIAKKTVRAPFDGLLGIRQVDRGEYLAPGARIVQLQRLSPIHVDYALPERHLDTLSPGLEVEITVQAYPDERFTGQVTALEPGVDPGTRSIRVRATLDNADERLRPGMFAEVATVLERSEVVRTLPRSAITYAPYGDSVFVVEMRDGTPVAQRRPVQTGEVQGDRVEIVAGLEAGERVVGAGQVKLRNGQPLDLVDGSGDGTASAEANGTGGS